MEDDFNSVVPSDSDNQLSAGDLFVHGSAQTDSTLVLPQVISKTLRLPKRVSKANANTPLVTTSLR
jgi:hypothetical protein